MRLREHPGVKGKIDAYPFDPRLLKVKQGYNVRDLDSAAERPELDELKASIKEHGVEEPLRVLMQGEDVFIVRGHRRHKAVMELIDEGEPIESVLVIQVPKGVNDADLNIDIVVSNGDDRKNLTQLQVAEVVARQYKVYKWTVPQIAKAISKTEGTVHNYLDIAGLGEAVKEQVRENVISPTLAKNIAKGVDPEFAADLIRKNAEENQRIKGKRRVTKTTLARAKKQAEPKPPAEAKAPQPEKQPEQPPAEPPPQPPAHPEPQGGVVQAPMRPDPDGPAYFSPLADGVPPEIARLTGEAPTVPRTTPMVAPETTTANTIEGTRVIDGMQIGFEAKYLHNISQWEVRVIDAGGDLTKDITDDPWTAIASMVEQAAAASRERMKELAQ